MGSIMIEENVVSAAGADNEANERDLRYQIREAGYRPAAAGYSLQLHRPRRRRRSRSKRFDEAETIERGVCGLEFMNSENDHFPGYDLRGCMVIGSVASLCPIFVFLFLASISYHPVFNTSTIDEMLDYGRIFFISFLSYFSMAVAVWKSRNWFARKFPIWFPVSVLGSILFVTLFAAWQLVDLLLGRVQDQWSGAAQIFWGMLISVFFLSIFTGIVTTIASNAYELMAEDPSIKPVS